MEAEVFCTVVMLKLGTWTPEMPTCQARPAPHTSRGPMRTSPLVVLQLEYGNGLARSSTPSLSDHHATREATLRRVSRVPWSFGTVYVAIHRTHLSWVALSW